MWKSSLALLLVVVGSAQAKTTDIVRISGSTPSVSVSLEGDLSRTLYRTEEYETTCYRTETYTDYETSCTTRYEQRCTTEAPTCVPVCRDVMRPVCNSSGCTDYPTRECTESCSGGGETCSSVPVGQDCQTFPVTRSREVPYSCTETRQVPYGTEIYERRRSHIELQVSGDVAELSGSDELRVDVPEGLDVSDFGVSITMPKESQTHLFYVTQAKRETISSRAGSTEIKYVYAVKIVDRKKVRMPYSELQKVFVSKTEVMMVVGGAPFDDHSAISMRIEKDKWIGPWKTILNEKLGRRNLKIENIPNGQKITISLRDLDFDFNRRPHRVVVSHTRDMTREFSKNLVNTSILKTMRVSISSQKTAEVRFK